MSSSELLDIALKVRNNVLEQRLSHKTHPLQLRPAKGWEFDLRQKSQIHSSIFPIVVVVFVVSSCSGARRIVAKPIVFLFLCFCRILRYCFTSIDPVQVDVYCS